MIQRILLLRVRDDVDRGALARRLSEAFPRVLGVREARVGLPADAAAEKSWDVSVVLAFDTLDAHDAGLASDTYAACMREEVEPNAQVHKGWSFATL